MPNFNQMQRRRLAAKRQAMPDGGFPIRNVADLKNAIQAFGRAKNKPAVKAWIKKRARELGATNLLPDNWRDDVLVHYGVLGMKWGVRRTPEQLGHVKKSIPNARKLDNYKGKLYFISESDIDGETLKPRVPKNYLTESGYEDNTTPRICFSDDPGKNLTALSQNVEGKTFYVYEPDETARQNLYKPNSKAVPDQEITNEMWVTEPTTIHKVGRILCIGDDGNDGMKYTYGDGKTAELYGWNYVWLDDKIKHSDYICHYGVLGMKWGVRRTKAQLRRAHKNIAKSYASEQMAENYSDRIKTNSKKKTLGYKNEDSPLRKIDQLNEQYWISQQKKYNEKASNYIASFMKSKYENIAKSSSHKKGKKYVDELVGLRLDPNKIDEYGKIYYDNYNTDVDYIPTGNGMHTIYSEDFPGTKYRPRAKN